MQTTEKKQVAQLAQMTVANLGPWDATPVTVVIRPLTVVLGSE